MSHERFVRWAIIGCGQIAIDKSLPALLNAQGAKLVAVADPLETRRAMVREALLAAGGDAPREYAEYRDLLTDPEIDAVYISLPTGMHSVAVIAAAAAKKAILCEKPLGRGAEESRRMIRAAEMHGVPLMTAYMSRFGDTYQKAAQLLAEGAIGQVTFVYANFSYPALGPYPPNAPGGWRWTDPEGGGPLLDIGVYLAFGLREILDDRVERVGGIQCDTVAPEGVENRDTTVAWFQTAKGIPGAFVATFSHAECRLLFYGTDGFLDLQRCFSQKPTGHLVCRSKSYNVEIETDVSEALPHYANYQREFEHFTQALLRGTPFQPSPEDVMADALLLDALKAGGERRVPKARLYLNEKEK